MTKGWHKEKIRHSNAKKYGHAGGLYKKNNHIEVKKKVLNIEKDIDEPHEADVEYHAPSGYVVVTEAHADDTGTMHPEESEPSLLQKFKEKLSDVGHGIQEAEQNAIRSIRLHYMKNVEHWQEQKINEEAQIQKLEGLLAVMNKFPEDEDLMSKADVESEIEYEMLDNNDLKEKVASYNESIRDPTQKDIRDDLKEDLVIIKQQLAVSNAKISKLKNKLAIAPDVVPEATREELTDSLAQRRSNVIKLDANIKKGTALRNQFPEQWSEWKEVHAPKVEW